MKQRALSIQLKLLKIWKQRQIVQNFPSKVSRNSTNCRNFKMQTTQPKILEILPAKLNGKKTSRKKFPKIWLYLARFGKYCAILYWKLPKAPKVTKQIEVIHSVLTESLITAWQSRNGNENFLTWNSKFRSDQTDRSKRTTCGSGPL